MLQRAVLRRTEPIPWASPGLVGRELEYVAQAVASTWISGGPFVDRFEKEFAALNGVPYATTAANGTAALHMAFLALGVGPGDEVIVPGFAFMAAANITLHMGARPVFAEVDPATWCMTVTDIERKVSSKTKLIVPIHTYGNMCPMSEILSFARGKSIFVLEDAAESLLSRCDGRLAGTQGTCGVFSFQATKTITTGEGGMVLTESPEIHEKLYLYRNHGMLKTRYRHEVAGHNFRMTNMQAALGCAQLEKIEGILSERARVYAAYQRFLGNIPGVRLQAFRPNVTPVVWAIAAKLDSEAFPQGRDVVMKQLAEAGIETRNGFYAASQMRHLYDSPELPISEDLSRNVISFPMFCSLQDADIEFICSTLDGLRR
jgi:perosamine synthetase